MASVTGVRQASAVGRRVVDVLAAAFADDPWLRWSLPDPGSMRSLMSLFLRTVGVPYGIVLVAGDPVVGVAVLMPPGAQAPDMPEVGEVVIGLHGRRIGPTLDAEAVLDRVRPADPGWVLHTLGVDPTAQGTGVGSALLDVCVQRATADGGRLTLETATATSRDFYLARGFVVTAEVDLSVGHGLGEDAPTVWLLARA